MVDHVLPKTLDEALETMKKGTYRPVAGGTDLMVRHRSWANTPPLFEFNLLYLNALDALYGITMHKNELEIRANTPYETILNHPATPPPLKACIEVLASPALRHVATLAGNIANASPAADAVLVLIMMDATARIRSASNAREVSIKDLITGPGQTDLNSEELITDIRIPSLDFTHTFFKKVGGRKADAISKIAFAGGARIEDGIIKDLNIALNAVNATVVRAESLEDAYIGKSVNTLKDNTDAFIEALDASIHPIDDQRSNKAYRRTVAHNLIRKFIETL